MKLSQLKKNEQKITRRFAFPPNAKPDDRFVVNVNYLSPTLFDEKKEEAKVRFRQGNKRGEELSDVEFRKIMARDILSKVVQDWTGMTIRKLRGLINMTAESVAALGGIDAEVDFSLDNLLFILEESFEFYVWLLETCQDLSQFQDSEWEEQIANLRPGQATSGEQR